MFERYTEKARRLIFFARFEASRYGSPYIETEHLLLGLLREDRPLVMMFLGEGRFEDDIRAEIEQQITQGERISTSVEMPLTTECKKVLNLASEEAQRLAHRHVGTEHVLLGMLRAEGSLAARLLQARGLKAAAVREKIATVFRSTVSNKEQRNEQAKDVIQNFLDGLKSQNSEPLIGLFAENSQFTDASGRRWGRDEISKNAETLFAHYAKKNSAPVVETTLAVAGLIVASVLWKNAILASEQRAWVHRMSVVMIWENEDWRILLMHVTSVQLP